jgi:hypothetical protein
MLSESRIDTPTKGRIINTTARLASGCKGQPPYSLDSKRLTDEVFRFCRGLLRTDGWLDVVVSAAALVRRYGFVPLEEVWFPENPVQYEDADWIYLGLQHLNRLGQENRVNNPWDDQVEPALGGFLELLHRGASLESPPKECLEVILEALSGKGVLPSLALCILHRAQAWFLDPNLQPLLEQYSVWSQVGQIVLEKESLWVAAGRRYIEMGGNLSKVTFWKTKIQQDIATWITVFSVGSWGTHDSDQQKIFLTVTRNLWVPDPIENCTFPDISVECWALALTALSNVWESFHYTLDASQQLAILARCTVNAALDVHYYDISRITRWAARTVFSTRLGASLTLAAQNAEAAISESNTGDEEHVALQRIAKLINTLGHKIATEFELGSGQVEISGEAKAYQHRQELQRLFQAELDTVEASLKTKSVPS